MNPNEHDHPDLTAHVLGELDAEHAEAMAQWIAAHPNAQVEAAQIGDLARVLAETAPVSFHTLLPHQRATVLSGPQRVRQLVAAVTQPKRREARRLPVLWGAVRVAAAAAFGIGGYAVGVHFRSDPGLAVATVPPAKIEKESGEAPHTPPFRAKEVPQPMVADASAPSDPSASAAHAPVAPVIPKTVVAVAPSVHLPDPTPMLAPAPPPKVIVAKPSNVVLSQPFVSPSKSAMAQVTLRPSETRSASAGKAPEGPLSASLSSATNKAPAAAPRAAKQPDLLIHSWKAEVMSCPWDETHRLVRLVIQMPGEQPAALSAANTYPLQLNFSASAVRNYRPLGERTIPALQSDSPAFHIAWFEVVPNGPLVDGAVRTLGDIVLPNAHFTTQAMAPFDGSTLHVLDRGATWQAAQQDFLFESAVVGFGLLLKGENDNGVLNHSLVLELAERSKEDDRSGERAKFIKLVEDARRVAGLK